MQILQLSEPECLEVLARASLARLACVRDRQPYVVPIHFSFDEARRCLYSFSSVGQKIEWMRENPRVCLEIEEIVDKYHWTTVLVFGRYQEVHDTPAHAEERRLALELFEKRREWWFPAAAKVERTERHAMVVFRVSADKITGRRSSRGA